MIYFLEDDDSIRKLVIYGLESQGFEAEGFSLPSAFWRAMEQKAAELVLLDIMLPEEDGLSITLYVMIRFGFAMAEVGGKVQKAVLAALHDMTGFNIHAVNVMIGGICFD